MTEQLHPRPYREPTTRQQRRQARREQRRWRLDCELIYDDGIGRFTLWFRTKTAARIAGAWKYGIASWGGTVELTDTRPAAPSVL